jgi:hypothetical protein
MALESLPSAVDVVEQPEQKRKGSGAIRISQVQIKDKNGNSARASTNRRVHRT